MDYDIILVQRTHINNEDLSSQDSTILADFVYIKLYITVKTKRILCFNFFYRTRSAVIMWQKLFTLVNEGFCICCTAHFAKIPEESTLHNCTACSSFTAQHIPVFICKSASAL